MEEIEETEIIMPPPYIRNDPKEIVNRLYKEFFSDRAPSIEEKLKEALEIMITDERADLKIDKVSNCLYEIWKNYAHEQLAEILSNFPKIEKMLLGAELTKKHRYRDHFLHMFNTYIFGALIISQIIKHFSENTESLEKIFKITSENESFPFPKPYSIQERILFLWTLMSSFHDVGIPIENLSDIREGLNTYLENFGLHLSELHLEQHTFVRMKLFEYLDSLSRFYEYGFKPDSTTGKYKIEYNNFSGNRTDNRVFLNKIINNLHHYDHGIISAICLLRGIEDAFLSGRDNEEFAFHDFTKRYEEYIFKQDIMRAALGITLHTYKVGENDVKIDFEKFPFAYLLILCDELQEFYRKENITLENITKLKDWPIPIVNVDESLSKITIKVIFQYEEISSAQEQALVENRRRFVYEKSGHILPEEYTYAKLLDDEWREIINNLKKKLKCSSGLLQITLGYTYKGEEALEFKINS